MSTLAARSNMSPSAASHMIDSLISQGMVERNQSATDRRTVLITISKGFQTTVAAVEEAQQKANEKLRNVLNEEEARVYDAVLEKLYSAVETQEEL